MGGSAFRNPGPNGEPGLEIPRMSSQVFFRTRDRYYEQLTEFFERVGAPHEAPEKLDHGDIDLLVELPKQNYTQGKLLERLCPLRITRVGPTTSYAIPNPDSELPLMQLDIHICKPGFLDWEYFTHSYGDFWHIISALQRSLGLTGTDEGLHVRVECIEKLNKARSRIHLTHDPVEVMNFLGLDHHIYHQIFGTEDGLFKWICAGRFWSKKALANRTESHNDRHRLKTRSMYRRFLEEWLPAHPNALPDSGWTREQILEEVLAAFHKREEFNERSQWYQAQVADSEFWNKISGIVPMDLGETSREVTVRGLKKWVYITEEGKPALRDEAWTGPLWYAGISDESKVLALEFIKENWKVVKGREKGRIAQEKEWRQADKRAVLAADARSG